MASAAFYAQAGKGRPKGTKNKLTATVKAAIEAAFQELGGAKYLVELGRENPQAFVMLLAKIIPQQQELTGKDGGPIQTEALDPQQLARRIALVLQQADPAEDQSSKAVH